MHPHSSVDVIQLAEFFTKAVVTDAYSVVFVDITLYLRLRSLCQEIWWFSLVVNLGTELEKGRAKMIQCFTLCSAILTDPNNVTQKRSRVMAAMDWLEFHPKNGYFARPVELYTTCVVRGSLADFIHPQWILCRCAYTDKKDRFTVDKI